MSLAKARVAASEPAWDEWRRRVPQLHRVQEASKFGDPTRGYEFDDLNGTLGVLSAAAVVAAAASSTAMVAVEAVAVALRATVAESLER